MVGCLSFFLFPFPSLYFLIYIPLLDYLLTIWITRLTLAILSRIRLLISSSTSITDTRRAHLVYTYSQTA